MKLQGKKALVTGGGRGIGKGIALEFAKAGADIALNDQAVSPDLEATAAEIRGLGRQVWLVAGDAFERQSCVDIAARAQQAMGRIDILASNPAYSKREAFLDFDPVVFDRVLQGTLYGHFHMSQLVARHMVQRGGGGKVVFIASVHSREPYAKSVAYNAGKSGLVHMSRTIANELAVHRINVNTIEPGWIDTPGEHATFGTEAIAREGVKLPWGRMGTPADIGKAALFLCSDDADYVTGTTLVVDGGFTLPRHHE